MRDKETIEIVLEAAETGHLVFSTMHTVDASATMERMVGVFPEASNKAIRLRFAKSFRYIISQRLVAAERSRRARGDFRDTEIHAAYAGIRGQR